MEEDDVKGLYVQIFFYTFFLMGFLSAGFALYYASVGDWLIVATSGSSTICCLFSLYLFRIGRTTLGIVITLTIGYFALMIGMTEEWGRSNLGLFTIYPFIIMVALILREPGLWFFSSITIPWLVMLYGLEYLGFFNQIVPATFSPYFLGFAVITLFLMVVLIVRYIIVNTMVINENLSIARGHAEKSARLKSVFLANMSHELRTPLNAIIGYSEGILEEGEYGGDIDEETLNEVRRILNSGTGLLEMINNILDISKIEAERMDLHPESIPVHALIEEVAYSGRGIAQKKGNQVSTDLPEKRLFITADRKRLSRALFNLVQYCALNTQDGEIRIDVSYKEDSHVLFRIEDNGPGIPPEEVPYIFELFHKSGTAGSTQYGLVMANKLLELIGGRIEFHSEVGVGTTFWVTLPLANAETISDSRL